MPYADKEKRVEYQRLWIARRRAEYFVDKCCEICGSTEGLELDHLDPAKKITHRIWPWNAKRRAEELAKCRVLCNPCHKERTSIWYAFRLEHGTYSKYKRGCKCVICLRGHANQVASWRRRTGRH